MSSQAELITTITSSLAFVALITFTVFFCCNGKQNVRSSPTIKVKKESESCASLRRQLNIPMSKGKITISVHEEYLNSNSHAYDGLNELIEQLLDTVSVYLIIQAQYDADEDRCKDLIRTKLPAIQTQLHHVLFYEKTIGKIAFVRQIKPQVHIEYENEVYKTLQPHVSNAIFHRLKGSTLFSLSSSNENAKGIESIRELLSSDTK